MSDRPLDIFILTDSPRPWMNDIYDARVIDISDKLAEFDFYSTGLVWRRKPVPPMLLARLLIPTIEELKGYEKVLYLDSDTEVWNPKLFTLLDRDGDFEITGVLDSAGDGMINYRIQGLIHGNEYMLDEDSAVFNRWYELLNHSNTYINSGVLVFHMLNFDSTYRNRIHYIIGRLKVLQPKYSDQDAINIYYKVNVEHDRRYNAWGRNVLGAYLRHTVGGERRKNSTYPLLTPLRPNVLDLVKENSNLGALSGKVDHVYILGENDAMEAWLQENNVLGVTKVPLYQDIDTCAELLTSVDNEDVSSTELASTLTHYKALMDAIRNGHEKIMVITEDFYPYELHECLNTLPNDYDIAVLDGFGKTTRVQAFVAHSADGYIINRKCMEDLRRLFESLWYPDTYKRQIRLFYKWINTKILCKERIVCRESEVN